MAVPLMALISPLASFCGAVVDFSIVDVFLLSRLLPKILVLRLTKFIIVDVFRMLLLLYLYGLLVKIIKGIILFLVMVFLYLYNAFFL